LLIIRKKQMIKFLIKGLMRDKKRSLFPVLVVAIGVFLTTLLYSWMMGVFNEMIDGNARFDTGHVKIMTQAYYEPIMKSPHRFPMIWGLLKLTALLPICVNRIPIMTGRRV